MKTVRPQCCSKPIEEREIRSALLAHLVSTHRRESRVLEEFRIERGGSRIDVAVIDKELIGYEIKSDRDTLARFSNQIHSYNRVFDRITLVCGATLADYAMDVVPGWWGVVVVSRNSTGGVCLSVKRVAGSNLNQSAFSLASLLWKEEALAVLSSADAEAPKQASSHALWDCIAKSLSIQTIRSMVAESILKRENYNELAVKTI